MDKMKIQVVLFLQSGFHDVEIMIRELQGLAIRWQEGFLLKVSCFWMKE